MSDNTSENKRYKINPYFIAFMVLIIVTSSGGWYSLGRSRGYDKGWCDGRVNVDSYYAVIEYLLDERRAYLRSGTTNTCWHSFEIDTCHVNEWLESSDNISPYIYRSYPFASSEGLGIRIRNKTTMVDSIMIDSNSIIMTTTGKECLEYRSWYKIIENGVERNNESKWKECK